MYFLVFISYDFDKLLYHFQQKYTFEQCLHCDVNYGVFFSLRHEYMWAYIS